MSDDIDREYLTMATMEGMRESSCYLAINDLIELYGAERCRAFVLEALNELDPPNAPTA